MSGVFACHGGRGGGGGRGGERGVLEKFFVCDDTFENVKSLLFVVREVRSVWRERTVPVKLVKGFINAEWDRAFFRSVLSGTGMSDDINRIVNVRVTPVLGFCKKTCDNLVYGWMSCRGLFRYWLAQWYWETPGGLLFVGLTYAHALHRCVTITHYMFLVLSPSRRCRCVIHQSFILGLLSLGYPCSTS